MVQILIRIISLDRSCDFCVVHHCRDANISLARFLVKENQVDVTSKAINVINNEEIKNTTRMLES